MFLDGDSADRAGLMARLVELIATGTHDFVLATRTRGGREKGAMAWHQALAGRLAGAAMRLFFGLPYTDMCAFSAIWRDVFAALHLRQMGYGRHLEMQRLATRASLRIMEAPLSYRRRAGGGREWPARSPAACAPGGGLLPRCCVSQEHEVDCGQPGVGLQLRSGSPTLSRSAPGLCLAPKALKG